MGGWRIFNSSLAFTVLFGFVMNAPAHALTCEEVPEQPGTRAVPKDEGGCEYYRTSDGTTVVTLTYADELSVDYAGGDPAVPIDPNDLTKGYKPGAYTCLHYYVERDGDLERVREVGHESVSVDKEEGQLTFEYPPEVGCEEGEEWVVKFEMYNGNPYVEMYDADREGFYTVSHIGYKSGGGSDEDLQLTLGTLACFNGGTGNSPATGDPTISGMAQVDETLTADTSNIRDANGLTNVSYTYQWLRVDGGTETPISGARSETYIIRAADTGKQLKVRVNFTDDDGHPESRTSDPTATVNSPATGVPTIDGTPQVDETLTANTDNIRDANGLTNVSYIYQWLRVDDMTETSISGANERTYMVTSADARKQLKVRVNFTDDDGHPESRTSDPTATVNSPATGVPTIDGTPQEGQRLTADTSAIMDADGLHGVAYSYQWIRVDDMDMTETSISGANEQTYMVTSADVGKKLKVQVTFTDDAFNVEELTSEPVGPVTAAPEMAPENNMPTGKPTILGTPQEGQRLTADTSAIMDADGLHGVAYSYQWIRVDDMDMTETSISGANEQTYMVTSADVGKKLKVQVTFTDDAFNVEELTSEPTEIVTEDTGGDGGDGGDGGPNIGGGGGGGGSNTGRRSNTGGRTEQETARPVGELETPSPDSFQSGISVICGWVCEADEVLIEINGQVWQASYGTERADTRERCGDSNNGFGLLFNWNLLGDGTHTLVVRADGEEFGRATVTVTTLGEEFVRGVMGETVDMDFPAEGTDARLVWEQSLQNFMLAPPEGRPAARPAEQPDLRKFLENPRPGSFQSGISVISGWVCEAETVEIEINGQIWRAGHGTERADTVEVCGDTNNGFGLLFNWNLLGDGTHTIRALADGVEFGRATFTVTTLGEEFVRDVMGETDALDFPTQGKGARLVWEQSLQNFMLAPPGKFLENPRPRSFQSGIGVISGWVCEADEVVIEIDGQAWPAAYGTARADTAEVCGDSNNGFGLLFNWNLLGDGTHTIRALADGVEFRQATFTVTTLGEEFVRGVMGEAEVMDFPDGGTDARLVWEQSLQNFMLAPPEGSPAARPAEQPDPRKFLENPRQSSFQSGIGLISGWVCEADEVVIEIDGQAWPAAYGTARADTAEVCGDSNNGFGLLFNWNLLGDDSHTIRALADGAEFGQVTFTITTLGEEFVQRVMGEAEVVDFPEEETDVRLLWQEGAQNFMIAPWVQDLEKQ